MKKYYLLFSVIFSIHLLFANSPELPKTIEYIHIDFYIDIPRYRDSANILFDLRDSTNTEVRINIYKRFSSHFYNRLISNVDSIAPRTRSNTISPDNRFVLYLIIVGGDIPCYEHCGIEIGINKSNYRIGYVRFQSANYNYNIYFSKQFSEELNNMVKKETISIKDHIN
jgi:hypothetical protein